MACIDSQCVEEFLPGGWGPEVQATVDDQALFTSEDVLEEFGLDLEDITAIAYRSQTVAGFNYIVKYRSTNLDGETVYFLARLFEPLPFTGEPVEVFAMSFNNVTESSSIPSFI